MGYQDNYNQYPGYRNNTGGAGSEEPANSFRHKSPGAVPPPFPGEWQPLQQQQVPYSPQGYYGSQYPQRRQESNGIGTAGFVLALVSFFGFWLPYVGGLTWLLGLIFSIIGVNRPPRGLAIAGLVISLVGFVFAVLAVLFFGVLAAGYDLHEIAAEFI
ncbi:MAG: EscU/YscU/HrcU family type III secretion system export apparatus switch protein [Bacteroidales bacterium]|nr:EscU/YscU/HrcU family type III secretion system export apparatus switch protein [Bacteroidales bacterium]